MNINVLPPSDEYFRLFGEDLETSIADRVVGISNFVVSFIIFLTFVLHFARRKVHPFNKRPTFFANIALIGTALLCLLYGFVSFGVLGCWLQKTMTYCLYTMIACGWICHSVQVYYISLKYNAIALQGWNKGKSADLELKRVTALAQRRGNTKSLLVASFVLFALFLGLYFTTHYTGSGAGNAWNTPAYKNHFISNFRDTGCHYPESTISYALMLVVFLTMAVSLVVLYNKKLRRTPDGLGLVNELKLAIPMWSLALVAFAVVSRFTMYWQFIMMFVFLITTAGSVGVRVIKSFRKASYIVNSAESGSSGGSRIGGGRQRRPGLVGKLARDLRKRRFHHEFTVFLQSEWASENLLFLDKVLVYRRLASHQKAEAATVFTEIWSTFFSPSAPLMINVDEEIQVDVKAAYKKFKSGDGQLLLVHTVFDQAYESILSLLAHDSYPRFRSLTVDQRLKLLQRPVAAHDQELGKMLFASSSAATTFSKSGSSGRSSGRSRHSSRASKIQPSVTPPVATAAAVDAVNGNAAAAAAVDAGSGNVASDDDEDAAAGVDNDFTTVDHDWDAGYAADLLTAGLPSPTRTRNSTVLQPSSVSKRSHGSANDDEDDSENEQFNAMMGDKQFAQGTEFLTHNSTTPRRHRSASNSNNGSQSSVRATGLATSRLTALTPRSASMDNFSEHLSPRRGVPLINVSHIGARRSTSAIGSARTPRSPGPLVLSDRRRAPSLSQNRTISQTSTPRSSRRSRRE